MRVVQYAVLAGGPCSPNVVKYLCLGIALGFLLSAGIIVLRVMVDMGSPDPFSTFDEHHYENTSQLQEVTPPELSKLGSEVT